MAEPAFVANTPIVSADMNSDLDDIIDMLTDSLSRSGDGGMQAALKLDNDGFTYSTDPNTGMSRSAANEQVITCGGVDTIEVTPTGATVNGNLEITGAVTSDGVAILPIGLGPLPWSGLTAPSKWVLAAGQSLLRVSYPDLWAFAQTEIAGGNTLWTNGNGTTTFTPPDMRGRVPGGKDNMGGSAANRLTSTTMTPDGNTLGASGGAQTQTLLTANLPAYTPAGSIVTTLTNGAGLAKGDSSAVGGGAAVAGTGAVTVTASSAFTGTPAPGQISTPVDKVQPTVIVNYIIYAGV